MIIYQLVSPENPFLLTESCHPNEGKLAGINFVVNIIFTYHEPQIEVENETSISQHVLNASGLNHVDMMDRIKYSKRKSSPNITNSNEPPKNGHFYVYR
jgi:hypothetical protein